MTMTPLRIATFNLENFDDGPRLPSRIAALRPALVRADADVLALQEVHGQSEGGLRSLRALESLLAGTRYQDYARATTLTEGRPYDERNLVVLSRFPIVATRQYRHDLMPAPHWRP